jgi:hypothetical protein
VALRRDDSTEVGQPGKMYILCFKDGTKIDMPGGPQECPKCHTRYDETGWVLGEGKTIRENAEVYYWLDELGRNEYEYGSDWADWWLNGGREPMIADYPGLSLLRAKEIAKKIRELAPAKPYNESVELNEDTRAEDFFNRLLKNLTDLNDGTVTDATFRSRNREIWDEVEAAGAWGRAGNPYQKTVKSEVLRRLREWQAAGSELPITESVRLKRQELLTADQRRALPKLYANEKVDDPIAVVKFFCPWNSWTWYATEFDGDDEFFGLVQGDEEELGYFQASELASVTGPGGLGIERDIHFTPTPLSKLRNRR